MIGTEELEVSKNAKGKESGDSFQRCSEVGKPKIRLDRLTIHRKSDMLYGLVYTDYSGYIIDVLFMLADACFAQATDTISDLALQFLGGVLASEFPAERQ